jgi:hypothetical protein
MASHFVSESVAAECVPESDISNAFLVEKLASANAELGERLKEGKKVAKVSIIFRSGLR